jgi:hypothetical protein
MPAKQGLAAVLMVLAVLEVGCGGVNRHLQGGKLPVLSNHGAF